MPLSRRYSPEHPPGESCRFGIDYSAVIPRGIVIEQAYLRIFTNVFEPAEVTSDWLISDMRIDDRIAHAFLTGGVEGTDYQFRWLIVDSAGNTLPRTVLVLCAQTS